MVFCHLLSSGSERTKPVAFSDSAALLTTAEAGTESGLKTGPEPALKTGLEPALKTGLEATRNTGPEPDGLKTGLERAGKTGLEPGVKEATEPGLEPVGKNGCKGRNDRRGERVEAEREGRHLGERSPKDLDVKGSLAHGQAGGHLEVGIDDDRGGGDHAELRVRRGHEHAPSDHGGQGRHAELLHEVAHTSPLQKNQGWRELLTSVHLVRAWHGASAGSSVPTGPP